MRLLTHLQVIRMCNVDIFYSNGSLVGKSLFYCCNVVVNLNGKYCPSAVFCNLGGVNMYVLKYVSVFG